MNNVPKELMVIKAGDEPAFAIDDLVNRFPTQEAQLASAYGVARSPFIECRVHKVIPGLRAYIVTDRGSTVHKAVDYSMLSHKVKQ